MPAMPSAHRPARTPHVAVRVVARIPAETPAGDVCLAGSLPAVGDWDPDGVVLAPQPDGTVAADVDLPVGEALSFKFTRGSWETVEQWPNGSDRADRSATITADTDRIDATVDRWAAGPSGGSVVGTLHLHPLRSAALGARRTIRAWLPPGYDGADHGRRYPVLYMFDGRNLSDRATSNFGHEWEVDESLTRLIGAGVVPPLIAVGLDQGRDRDAEYTFGRTLPSGSRAAATEAFLLREVIPFVDRAYRTAADGRHRLLGGSSLGGLITLDIARRNPGAFAGLMAMSPALSYAGGATLSALCADASPLAGARVWLDIGTTEGSWVASTRRLANGLTRQGVDCQLVVAEGAMHDERAWAARFPAAIAYLTAALTG
jgi:predicted alpha/beta superfamily hydrolase